MVVLAAVPALAAPISSPEIEAERARAQSVLDEIAAIDADLELAVDAYNGATYELGQIQAEIETNQRHLKLAKDSYRAAQRNLSERIVTLYENGEQDVIEVLLGSANLNDLLDRLDSAQRISSQDAQIIESVAKAKADIKQREKRLEQAQERQEEVVATRAAQRQSIEGQLAERQSLYASIKDQIVELEAAERERRERLAAEARRREQERQEEQDRLAAAASEAGVSQAVVAQVASASPQGIGTAPASQLGARAVAISLQYLGIKYVWGAADPNVGFDCSGLVMYVYAQLGISLPHNAAMMYNTSGVPVSYSELQPGDLVFANSLGHMGMYIGGGQYIAAPQTGDVVRIFNMADRSDWVGFKRVA